MWASPMLEMTAMSGFTISVRYSISPKWFMPVSMTAAWCSLVSPRRVRGVPTSLL